MDCSPGRRRPCCCPAKKGRTSQSSKRCTQMCRLSFAALNYGTRYPFISAQTGGFYDEADLPDLLASIHRNDYAQLRPRSWIIEHWSPTASTRVLEQAIYGSATGRLQVKVNAPDLAYLDRGERGRLAEEYALLRSYLRPN